MRELRVHQRLFVMGEGSKVLGLHHVQLAMPPGEEDAAVKFYGAILGLPQVPKPEGLADRGGVWFRDDGVEVHLGVEEPFSPARKAHPAFLVRNLDTIRARIETAGYRVTDDIPLPGFHRCHVRDPFGNRVELVEPEG